MLMPNHEPECNCHAVPSQNRLRPAAVVPPKPLHRIAEVRALQGVSLRAARQGMMLSSEDVRQQENENYDLRLSELYRWQQLLDVPVSELLHEPLLQLSEPVSARAGMIKVMKTAVTMLENAHDECTQTLTQRLIEQLLEVMPELAGVSGWPAVGQRRTLDEVGRIAQCPLSVAPPDDY